MTPTPIAVVAALSVALAPAVAGAQATPRQPAPPTTAAAGGPPDPGAGPTTPAQAAPATRRSSR